MLSPRGARLDLPSHRRGPFAGGYPGGTQTFDFTPIPLEDCDKYTTPWIKAKCNCINDCKGIWNGTVESQVEMGKCFTCCNWKHNPVPPPGETKPLYCSGTFQTATTYQPVWVPPSVTPGSGNGRGDGGLGGMSVARANNPMDLLEQLLDKIITEVPEKSKELKDKAFPPTPDPSSVLCYSILTGDKALCYHFKQDPIKREQCLSCALEKFSYCIGDTSANWHPGIDCLDLGLPV